MTINDIWKVIGGASGIVSIISAIITIIALFYAVRVARKQNKDADDQLSRLTLITNRMSTQYMKPFPLYLSEVAQLISEATTSIEIMAMVCSHGSFSAPEDWDHVRFALKHKVVEAARKRDDLGGAFKAVLLYGSREKTFIKYHQLTGGVNWALYKARQKNKDRFEMFCQTEGHSANWDNLTKEEFVELRYKENERVREQVYRASSFEIGLCHESMPMYLWIRDGKEAIFSVRAEDLQGAYSGGAIRTNDRQLVEELQTLFNYYHSRSDFSINAKNLHL